MAIDRVDGLRIFVAVANAATIGVLFSLFYNTKTPLIFNEHQPRVCEFVYGDLDAEPKQNAIATCLALQVGDVFAQVFFLIGIALMLAGLIKAPSETGLRNAFSSFLALSTIGLSVLIASRSSFLRVSTRKLTPQLSTLIMDVDTYKITLIVGSIILGVNILYIAITAVLSVIGNKT